MTLDAETLALKLAAEIERITARDGPVDIWDRDERGHPAPRPVLRGELRRLSGRDPLIVRIDLIELCEAVLK